MLGSRSGGLEQEMGVRGSGGDDQKMMLRRGGRYLQKVMVGGSRRLLLKQMLLRSGVGAELKRGRIVVLPGRLGWLRRLRRFRYSQPYRRAQAERDRGKREKEGMRAPLHETTYMIA